MGAGPQRSGTMMAQINITPMVDVMLVLLIIFMLTSKLDEEAKKDPVADCQALHVDVPQTEVRHDQVKAADDSFFALTMNARYQVALGENLIATCEGIRDGKIVDAVKLKTCFASVRDKLKDNPRIKAGSRIQEERMFVAAANNLPYGVVIELVGVLKEAGMTKVGLVTEYLAQLQE